MELSITNYSTDLMIRLYRYNYKCLEEVRVRVIDHEDEMRYLKEQISELPEEFKHIRILPGYKK